MDTHYCHDQGHGIMKLKLEAKICQCQLVAKPGSSAYLVSELACCLGGLGLCGQAHGGRQVWHLCLHNLHDELVDL